MRIDVVSIFPDYLSPLGLSLVGKAITSGLVELGVHDLRDWTHDRHRTVDDTPYGGGPGMVMTPEPWGEALDAVSRDDRTTLVVCTPSGRPFTQDLAAEFATRTQLVFACGRYEGIDARVVEHARTRIRVEEISVGDYVLNGGEAAALVMIEAVVRLIPGVIGNPESLTEESHAAGHDRLLEYPVYTKPPRWRDLEVPEVLFSGHHARIAAWRREQAVALTRHRRPELLPDGMIQPRIRPATAGDAGELLTVQRGAYVTEAQVTGVATIPPLTQTLAELTAEIATEGVLVATHRDRIIGSVRARREDDGAWYIGRLLVAPDQQGRGLGSRLLAAAEALAPADCSPLRLITGSVSAANLAFYTRRGYREVRTFDHGQVAVTVLEKTR